MLSRVANSIFWMSRYIERAENYARFMDVNLSLIMDLPKNMSEQWKPLIYITGDELIFESNHQGYSRDDVIKFLTYDKNNHNSILSCLIHARENARTIREIISNPMWRQINEMYLMMKDTSLENDKSLPEFFQYIKNGAHLFNGIMDSTLIHNEAYHFANLGRLIERAEKTDRILDMKYFYLLPRPEDVGTSLDYMQWSALLNSTSAYEVYRRKYGKLDYRDIIHFLIFDREFPRAIYFCLLEADKSLHTISNTQTGTFNNSAEKELGRVLSQLSFNDVKDVIQVGLHEYLDDLQVSLNRLGDEVFETFFVQTQR